MKQPVSPILIRFSIVSDNLMKSLCHRDARYESPHALFENTTFFV